MNLSKQITVTVTERELQVIIQALESAKREEAMLASPDMRLAIEELTKLRNKLRKSDK